MGGGFTTGEFPALFRRSTSFAADTSPIYVARGAGLVVHRVTRVQRTGQGGDLTATTRATIHGLPFDVVFMQDSPPRYCASGSERGPSLCHDAYHASHKQRSESCGLVHATRGTALDPGPLGSPGQGV